MTTLEKTISVFKEVMYLDENEEVDVNKSLFLDYDMNSIDFIDFAFEIKKAFSLSVGTDDLWPVGKLATMSEYYDGTSQTWTEEGIKQLKLVLACSGQPVELDPKTNVRSLYKYFSLEFVSRKIKELQNTEAVG
ncbi:hypothetical protein COMNV_01683 [Commensalibacter sp. Nvir]|uniref:acyl carrier protein n=1 Tax=Commensalibacter sp. Nvir TaxID=3069817 RepID=UPI002D3BB6F7|nr:hypothetical protein COMNV_01683 [Commensalibacter sp. Nvir]